jgi:hypothetical protein
MKVRSHWVADVVIVAITFALISCSFALGWKVAENYLSRFP